MKELIEKLTTEAGLTEKQALQSISIIKDYAKQKFPIFSGAIEKVFEKYSPKEDDDFMA
jgi:hypothetical protein